VDAGTFEKIFQVPGTPVSQLLSGGGHGTI